MAILCVLQLGLVNTTTSVTCETSHLSSFGMNMFVPPNTIDFSTVFSKFSADNLAVLITVGLVLLAYFLLLIPVIRADRKDFKKVNTVNSEIIVMFLLM